MRKVVALGDIFCDHISEAVDDPDCLNRIAGDAGHDIVAGISVEVGGGGLQFAIEARRLCPQVTLIGKVGALSDGSLDADAARAAEILRADDIHTVLAKDFKNATGRSIIVYFAEDRRFMISDSAANLTLNQDDISAEVYAEVRSASLLHISGYLLVQEERRAVVVDLMTCARAAGVTVALDLVPHELDRFIDTRNALPDIMAKADWIYAAASTARRTLGVSSTDPRELAALLSGGKRSVAVYPHPGQALVLHRGQFCYRTFDYAPGRDSRGQSARTQAHLMHEFV